MPRLASAVVVLVVLACGPGPGTTGTTDSGTTDSTTSTASEPTTSSSTTTLAPSLMCEGCELVGSEECTWNIDNCEVPEPCGQLNADDEEATTCVLGLLRDRGYARFSYCWQCSGPELLGGEFFIRGPDRDGLQLQCYQPDFGADITPTYQVIDPPEHFAGCLELVGQEPRLDCLRAGLHLAETAQCERL